MLAVILLVPLVCQKVHLPSIIGLIMVGLLLGPHGVGILHQTETISVLSQIGMLYVLFITGIGVDIQGFRDTRRQSILFGLCSFAIPAILGIVAGRWCLGMGWLSTLLLSSIFASHTLMTFPVVSRYGIQKDKSINLVVGGTLLAETLAMLMLAGVSSLAHGELTPALCMRLAVGCVAFVLIVVVGMPRLCGWFFKRFGNPTEEFIFVLLMATLAGVLAEWTGLEPILGVFLAGVSLNRMIPSLSPLMNRINFVGNAIFIPIFLLSVGMLIDLSAFTHGWEAMWVAIVMCVGAIGGKWIAAWVTQRIERLLPCQRQLLFGLTTARAAGALAIVTIGYNLVLQDGTRLFSENILNATIILILISCTIAGFLTEYGAKGTAMADNSFGETHSKPMHMLLPVANPDTSEGLMSLALLTLARNPQSSLHALRIIRQPEERKQAEQLLDEVTHMGAAVDRAVHAHVGVAASISNGIREVMDEHCVNWLLMGLQTDLNQLKNRNLTYGDVANQLLATCSLPITLFHPVQPLSTCRKIRVAVPRHAEAEVYMLDWVDTLQRLSEQLDARVIFYAGPDTTPALKVLSARPERRIQAEYRDMQDWEDLLQIAKEIQEDDLLFVVAARRNTVSYHQLYETTPYVLNRFFHSYSYMVVYPRQEVGSGAANTFFSDVSVSGESNRTVLQKLLNRYYNLKRRWQ